MIDTWLVVETDFFAFLYWAQRTQHECAIERGLVSVDNITLNLIPMVGLKGSKKEKEESRKMKERFEFNKIIINSKSYGKYTLQIFIYLILSYSMYFPVLLFLPLLTYFLL